MALGLLKKWWSRSKLPNELGYEAARAALEGQAQDIKRELAAREDAPPETLDYLAAEADAPTRVAVAANPSTPIQANELLVADVEDEVRTELAHKIARLLPDMSEGEQGQLRQRVIALLEKLAQDNLPRIRMIVAEAIKSRTDMPTKMIARLARDAELEVCAPILQYSPLLSDEDMLELIATVQVEGALEVVAARENLSAAASDAIIATLDISAVAGLLANPKASIRAQSLDRIITKAAKIDQWHAPLVLRTDLSRRAMQRIATFVSRSLVDRLVRVNKLDERFAAELKATAEASLANSTTDPDLPDVAVEAVNTAYARGELNDEVVIEAATLRQRAAVIRALGLRSGIRAADIAHILKAGSGRGITALCWKAGLSMRTALAIEMHIANLPKQSLILPRDGTDFPMSDDEMIWNLQYFGIEV